MDEETSVSVEETTEVSQPETNAEVTEAQETEEVEESSEETENTAEVKTEKPKSRASERIRELIAQKKALEARLQEKEPQIEGYDDTGIDPTKFAQSLEKKASLTANKAAQSTVEYYIAEKEFPLVKENTFVRSRAGELVDQGYSPVQAAELASLEWQETTGQEAKKVVQRQKANQNLRNGAQIPSAGKKVASNGNFTRAEIAAMKPQEYVKNQAAIQAQLEKYGPESFE